MRDRHLAGLPFAHTHSTSCVCVREFPSRLAKAQLLSKCHRRVSVSPCCAGLPRSRFAPLCGRPVPAISASITELCVNPPNTKKVRLPPARTHSATSVRSTLQRTSLRPPAGRCYLALSDATQSDALSIILQDFSSFFSFFFGAALLCPA